MGGGGGGGSQCARVHAKQEVISRGYLQVTVTKPLYIYMCIYICMYVCMYVYIYIFIYIYICILSAVLLMPEYEHGWV